MILFLYLKWENNGKYNIIFMIFISTRLAFTCINCAILRMSYYFKLTTKKYLITGVNVILFNLILNIII